jgi:hypothetical protein
MEVERNPTGAWMAIQEQAVHIEELEAKLAKAMEALRKSAILPFSHAARIALDELEKPNDI